MLATVKERKRRAKRVPAMLTPSIPDHEDNPLSLYFEVNTTFGLGERIDFIVEIPNPGGNLRLRCNGEIIQKENRNGKVGMIVKKF